MIWHQDWPRPEGLNILISPPSPARRGPFRFILVLRSPSSDIRKGIALQIGGTDNFCLQKSRMSVGRIDIFKFEKLRYNSFWNCLRILSFLNPFNTLLKCLYNGGNLWSPCKFPVFYMSWFQPSREIRLRKDIILKHFQKELSMKYTWLSHENNNSKGKAEQLLMVD